MNSLRSSLGKKLTPTLATVPVTVSYRITPLGIDLTASLRLMIDWAETRMPEVREAQVEFDARSSE